MLFVCDTVHFISIFYFDMVWIKDFYILSHITKISSGNGKGINEEFYLYT